MRRSNLKRLGRGQATVEMSIAVIILVPTIMYTLFLEDLLYFKLEMYETVSSPAWDYLGLNYNKEDPDLAKFLGDDGFNTGAPAYKGWLNGRYARLTYCDHTSAYNSYDIDFECGDNHHDGTTTTAHQCWIVPDAKQVGCQLVKDTYLAGASLPGMSDWDGTYNKGGVLQCGARLGVMNFFLPNKLFTWSEKRNANDKSYQVSTKNRYKSGNDDRQGDDAHGNAASGKGVDSAGSGDIIMAAQEFAVLHDPWATNYPPNSDGDNSNSKQNGKFHDRMEVYYSAHGGKLQTAKAFGQQALSDVLGAGAIYPALKPVAK